MNTFFIFGYNTIFMSILSDNVRCDMNHEYEYVFLGSPLTFPS